MTIRNLDFNFNILHEISEKSGLTEKLEKELYDFKLFLDEKHDFKQFIEDPRIAADYKKSKLREILPENTSNLFFSIVGLLIDRGREDLVAKLSIGFTKRVFSVKNEIFTEVESVVSLEKNAENRIKKVLEKIVNGKIYLRNIIKPKVLGGIKIKIINNRVIDLSLQQRLLDLQMRLREGAN